MRILFDSSNLEGTAEQMLAQAPDRFPDLSAAKEFIYNQVRAEKIPSKPTYEQRQDPFCIYKGIQALPSEMVLNDHPHEPTIVINLYRYIHKEGANRDHVSLP